MREKIRLEKIWVVSLLPALAFLLLGVSYAVSTTTNNADIQATVSLIPAARIYCIPRTLIEGSSVDWIVCRIELEGEDVNNIDVSTVRMNVVGSTCSIPADTSFFSVGDSDNNGINDALVRFSRNAADTNCFLPISASKDFTLVVSGKVDVFPFSGTNTLHYIKTCQDVFVQQMQANTTTGSGKIVTLSSQTVDLNKYSARTFSLNGFFTCRNQRIIGDMKFFSTGTLTEPVHINWIPGLDFVYYKKTPVRIAAVFNTFDNCFANSTPYVECVGKGSLLIDKDQPFSRETINLDTIRLEVNGKKAKIQGGEFFNEIIDVENLVVSKVSIRPGIPKI